MLGWDCPVSHERNSRSCTAAPARTLAVPGTERSHVRDLRRQARRIFLQPRRSESARSLGGTPLLSSSLFSCSHDGRISRQQHFLLLAPLSIFSRISRTLPSD